MTDDGRGYRDEQQGAEWPQAPRWTPAAPSAPTPYQPQPPSQPGYSRTGYSQGGSAPRSDGQQDYGQRTYSQQVDGANPYVTQPDYALQQYAPYPHPGQGVQAVSAQGYYPVPTSVAPKNPGLAVVLSLFLPGLGSIVNGDLGKGLGFLFGTIACWMLFFFFLPLIGIPILWIWSMVDAYNGAVEWNRRHGIVS